MPEADYAAFMSYSHERDAAFARTLQSSIERYGRPWYRPRARRVFLDEGNLALNPDLWTSIKMALESSECLLLLSSPSAARSLWVTKEVSWWLENREQNKLHFLLTDGNFVWDELSQKVDRARTDAMPPVVIHAIQREPRLVDLRELRTPSLARDNPEWQNRLAEIVAAVDRVPKDALIGDHIRQARRTRTLIVAVLTILLLLLAFSVSQWASAREQQHVAEEQSAAATAQQIIATSRQLLAQAETISSSDPRAAVGVALAAYKLVPNQQAEAALFRLVQGTHVQSSTKIGDAAVTSMAFNPRGDVIAFGSDNGTLALWGIDDRRGLSQLGRESIDDSTTLSQLSFSPDGKTLATSGGFNRPVVLWDVSDPNGLTRIAEVPQKGDTMEIAFSPNGRILATSTTGKEVVLWDISELKTPFAVGEPVPQEGWAMGFSSDGETLAIGDGAGIVHLWDISNPEVPAQMGNPIDAHPGQARGLQFAFAITSVAFSKDDHILAVGSSEETLVLWDIKNSGTPIQIGVPLQSHTGLAQTLRFLPDGHTLAAGGTQGVTILWDLTDPIHPTKVDQTLLDHSELTGSVAISYDGRAVATSGFDGTVILWALRNEVQPIQIGKAFTRQSISVNALAMSPQAPVLASVSSDGSVLLWDISRRDRPTPFGQPMVGHTDMVGLAAFSPDGRTLATSGWDEVVILWDVSKPSAPHRIGTPLDSGETPVSLAFSPDGRTLVISSVSRPMALWDIGDPARPVLVGEPLHDGPPVSSSIISPDGNFLVVGGTDGTLRIIGMTPKNAQPQVAAPVQAYGEAVNSMAFSQDGLILATATGQTDRDIKLWSVSTQNGLTEVGEPLTGRARTLALGPGGILASSLWISGDESQVRLWDASDPFRPSAIGKPLEQSQNPTSIVFSSDGRTMATNTGDSIVLWDLSGIVDLHANLHVVACAVAEQGLQPQEWTRYIPDLPYEQSC